LQGRGLGRKSISLALYTMRYTERPFLQSIAS
jgi:hypothetical protein